MYATFYNFGWVIDHITHAFELISQGCGEFLLKKSIGTKRKFALHLFVHLAICTKYFFLHQFFQLHHYFLY